MDVGSGWWNHPNEHSLARKGVRTAFPERVKMKKASKRDFDRLPNRIQNSVQDTSRVLKRLSNAHPKNVKGLSVVALGKYNTLKGLIRDYTMDRSLPGWTKKDWVGRENWNNNGYIYGIVKGLGGASRSEEIVELQGQLRRALELKR